MPGREDEPDGQPPAGGERADALLLVGRPGVGKTTALRRAADRLSDLRIRGFYTQEMRGGSGRRTGFRALPFGTGEEPEEPPARIIASVEVEGPPRVGKYGVDVPAIDEIARRHLDAGDADAVLVDEIGKMECFSEPFVDRVREILAGTIPMVATVARRGGGFILEVKQRPGSRVQEVSEGNRDRLPAAIAEWVRDATG